MSTDMYSDGSPKNKLAQHFDSLCDRLRATDVDEDFGPEPLPEPRELTAVELAICGLRANRVPIRSGEPRRRLQLRKDSQLPPDPMPEEIAAPELQSRLYDSNKQATAKEEIRAEMEMLRARVVELAAELETLRSADWAREHGLTAELFEGIVQAIHAGELKL